MNKIENRATLSRLIRTSIQNRRYKIDCHLNGTMVIREPGEPRREGAHTIYGTHTRDRARDLVLSTSFLNNEPGEERPRYRSNLVRATSNGMLAEKDLMDLTIYLHDIALIDAFQRKPRRSRPTQIPDLVQEALQRLEGYFIPKATTLHFLSQAHPEDKTPQ